QKVVQHQRDQFFSSLANSGGWKRLWFATRRTESRAEPRHFAPDRGYSGRLEKLPSHLLDGKSEDLSAWITWLRSMEQGERRGDFEEILGFQEYVYSLEEVTNRPHASHALLCALIAFCQAPADDVRLVFFNHDQFIDELGHRLFEPAVLQLQNVPFAERQPL